MMPMHSPEEISEGLGCLTTHKHPCAGCPFNPYPGRDWPYGCIKGQADIVDEARELLEELEGFKEYFDDLHGQGLEISNWHMNGTEPFDSFYESALEERAQLHGNREGENHG
ncbi:MAG: hypothetical protein IJG86_01895 [Clostridia bacterium]|nr:hypothetical protein [Clostridia bacterium]